MIVVKKKFKRLKWKRHIFVKQYARLNNVALVNISKKALDLSATVQDTFLQIQ